MTMVSSLVLLAGRSGQSEYVPTNSRPYSQGCLAETRVSTMIATYASGLHPIGSMPNNRWSVWQSRLIIKKKNVIWHVE